MREPGEPLLVLLLSASAHIKSTLPFHPLQRLYDMLRRAGRGGLGKCISREEVSVHKQAELRAILRLIRGSPDVGQGVISQDYSGSGTPPDPGPLPKAQASSWPMSLHSLHSHKMALGDHKNTTSIGIIRTILLINCITARVITALGLNL